jgi:hypothetical protein
MLVLLARLGQPGLMVIAVEMLDKIKAARKEDLAKYSREMCDGNIIFKALRRADYIGKLIRLKNLTYDKINSL